MVQAVLPVGANIEYYQKLLMELLKRVLDKNKRVQEAACRYISSTYVHVFHIINHCHSFTIF